MSVRVAIPSPLRIAIAAAAVAAACSRDPATPRPPQIEVVPSPAPPGAAQPFLAVTDDYRLHLSWLARKSGGDQVEFTCATRAADGWLPSRAIATGSDLLVNWADVPSLIQLPGGALAAHWPVHHPGGEHACDIRVNVSADGIRWPETQVRTPHRDGLAVEHAFASLVATGPDAFTCVWLDGRAYDGKEEGAPGAESQLRAADWSAGEFGAEVLLDPRVCDCCPTAAVRTGDGGLLVAYRDRSDDEVRDIALVRRDAHGTWSEPYALSNEGWRIAGCPVNGPALAARGDEVVACWFTMQGDSAVVKTARSHDGGVTFGPARRIDNGLPAGRADVTLLPDGDALCVWIEMTTGGSGDIRARRLSADGSAGEPFTVAATTADRAAGHPRVATAGDQVWFAWTETGTPSHVRTATMRTPSRRMSIH